MRRLRSLTGLGLAELAAEAEVALGLDIEVLARPGWTPGAARAHLDAFADVAARLRRGRRPGLARRVPRLARRRGRGGARARPRLDRGPHRRRAGDDRARRQGAGVGRRRRAGPGRGRVPGPLGHPHLAQRRRRGRTPPPPTRAGSPGWPRCPTTCAATPRGCPRFAWSGHAGWDDLATEHQRFREAVADHGIVEERRLAYVAVTRARTDLLLTAHVWGTASTPRITSRFLDEVQRVRAGRGARARGSSCHRSTTRSRRTREPPRRSASPGRRSTTASAVRPCSGPPGRWPTRWRMPRLPAPGRSPRPPPRAAAGPLGRRDPDAARRAGPAAVSGADVDVALPAHLSTSALVALAEDAERFTLDLRRPMPTPPAPAARRGTAFHAWVEEHYSRAAFVDVDELPGSADDDAGRHRPRPPCGRASWPASGPTARRSRSRPASRPWSTASRCAGGSTRSSRRSRPTASRAGSVVDWKTGAPASGARAAARALQLSAYRLAWARLRGVPEHRVRGAFFHAATGETVWPELPGRRRDHRVLAAARPT